MKWICAPSKTQIQLGDRSLVRVRFLLPAQINCLFGALEASPVAVLCVEVAPQMTAFVRAGWCGALARPRSVSVAVQSGHVHIQGGLRGAALAAAQMEAPDRLLDGLAVRPLRRFRRRSLFVNNGVSGLEFAWRQPVAECGI